MNGKNVMDEYRYALEKVYMHGVEKTDRTGVGTISLHGIQMRFEDVGESFPLLTGKETHWPSILAELLWFIRGSTNINDLDATIWDEWADENGELGPIYGSQWRNWTKWDMDKYGYAETSGIDQLANMVDLLRTDPTSRRNIVSAWNVSDLDEMALAPCHFAFQALVAEGQLDLIVSQRSADMFLGVPFNIASYAALNIMLSKTCDLSPGAVILNLGDAHIYQNHRQQTVQLLSRAWPDLPRLEVDDDWANNCGPENFHLQNYFPLPKIPAPVAV